MILKIQYPYLGIFARKEVEKKKNNNRDMGKIYFIFLPNRITFVIMHDEGYTGYICIKKKKKKKKNYFDFFIVTTTATAVRNVIG